MPTLAMTDKALAKLKPKPGERLVLFDSAIKSEGLGGGLCLRAGQSSKVFYVLHYEAGKPKYFKLGRYPALSLKDARAKVRAFLENPKIEIEKREGGSFKEVAEDFLARYVRKKGLRSEHETVRLLNTLVYPRWGAKAFRDLSRSDVTKLLDRIEDKNGARQADNVLAILRKMMNWFETRHDAYRSPITQGMNRKSVKASARSRILSDDEIRVFWKAAGEIGTYGALARFALLTGQRRAKVVNLRWIDVEDGLWSIATARREKGNAGTLPLPAMALEIIEGQPEIAGNPYVFAASIGQKALNSFSKGKKALDLAMRAASEDEIAPWVFHDLRRTCRSLMARAGVLPHIAERVLGHAMPGVEGVYDRHEYTDEKGEALEQVAALIDGIINPPVDNVVPIRQAQAAKSRQKKTA